MIGEKGGVGQIRHAGVFPAPQIHSKKDRYISPIRTEKIAKRNCDITAKQNFALKQAIFNLIHQPSTAIRSRQSERRSTTFVIPLPLILGIERMSKKRSASCIRPQLPKQGTFDPNPGSKSSLAPQKQQQATGDALVQKYSIIEYR